MKELRTCPVEPVPLKLFAVVALEHLVDADDVASVVGGRPFVGWINRWPRDGRYLKKGMETIIIKNFLRHHQNIWLVLGLR